MADEVTTSVLQVHVAGDLHLNVYTGHAPILVQSLQRVEAALEVLRVQGVQLMADSAVVTVQLDRLNLVTNDIASTIDTVVAADAAEDAAFRAEIQRLNALLAAGETITQEQLNTAAAMISQKNDALETVSAQLKTIGATSTDPLPEPTARKKH